ncbi:hypothetical protein FOA52_009102 [Chlamydomonas sp. UWO 241]|nr:hypothetical protein FOA52_009102 [Chlamydomonas sp. UWO 241]
MADKFKALKAAILLDERKRGGGSAQAAGRSAGIQAQLSASIVQRTATFSGAHRGDTTQAQAHQGGGPGQGGASGSNGPVKPARPTPLSFGNRLVAPAPMNSSFYAVGSGAGGQRQGRDWSHFADQGRLAAAPPTAGRVECIDCRKHVARDQIVPEAQAGVQNCQVCFTKQQEQYEGESGTLLMITDDRDGTAPMAAAEAGQEVAMRLLLKHAAHPAAMMVHAGSSGQTALMLAADSGYVDCARLLLNHPSASPADMMVHADIEGQTAFMLAAASGHADVMRLLLDHPSADPAMMMHVVKFGWIALIAAAETGHVDAMRVLLDHPAADAAAMLMHADASG